MSASAIAFPPPTTTPDVDAFVVEVDTAHVSLAAQSFEGGRGASLRNIAQRGPIADQIALEVQHGRERRGACRPRLRANEVLTQVHFRLLHHSRFAKHCTATDAWCLVHAQLSLIGNGLGEETKAALRKVEDGRSTLIRSSSELRTRSAVYAEVGYDKGRSPRSTRSERAVVAAEELP